MHNMSKNVFICHRPYHILRSCDIVSQNNGTETQNILVAFDVVLENNRNYQRFDTNKLFYPCFNEVVEVKREKEPSTRSFFKYIRYGKEKRNYYLDLVNSYFDADNIYFYCDDELEIEIMVSLFKKYGSPSMKRILIDEGLVTYADTSKRLTKKGKLYAWLLYGLMGIKGLNYGRAYGGSSLYNHCLANRPDKANFRHPVGRLRPIADTVLDRLRKNMDGATIDENSPYFLYITTSLVPFEKEREIVKGMLVILSKLCIPFYIKHHPQQNVEPFESYLDKNCFLEKGYPVELFFGSKAIIAGVGSSSLLNASLQGFCVLDLAPLFEIQKYSISMLYEWIEIVSVESLSKLETVINGIIKQ